MARNMTEGKPSSHIIAFALPMLMGSVFQQMYNVVDSIIVGKFVGPNALAAIGTATAPMILFISLLIGMGVGISVIISQFYGANELDSLKRAISTTVIFAAVMVVVITVSALFLTRPLLVMMNTPPEILQDSMDYLYVIFGGLVFMVIYNCYEACFRGIGDSKTPLMFLIISALSNVGLDLLLVLKFNMGVKGTAIATVISQAISGILCFFYVTRYVPVLRLKFSELVFDKEMFKTIVRFSVPSAIQQSIISVGVILVQSLVNSFGAPTMAAYAAAVKIDSFATMPGMNIGNALATFVGQNIGAGKKDRVKSGLFTALRMQWVLCIIVSAVVISLSKVLMLIFINSWETEVIAIGTKYLITVGSFYLLMGTMQCFSGLLRGTGDMTKAMAMSFVNLGTRVVGAYSLAYWGWFGARAIWYAIPLGWAAAALLGFLVYQSGHWGKRVVSKKAAEVEVTDLLSEE